MRPLEILVCYGVLSGISVFLVWVGIARKGFVGLELSDSPVARLFRPFMKSATSPHVSDFGLVEGDQPRNAASSLGAQAAYLRSRSLVVRYHTLNGSALERSPNAEAATANMCGAET
jgi:hypothetical protein